MPDEPPGRTAPSVLHADLDAFYASVEQRDDPRLRGRPVIVGGGVVLAASYQAKARGVRTAMGGRQARRLCPDAAVVPPRFAAYSAASTAVFAVFRDTTPLVEGISIDEAFLDVGGLRNLVGPPELIAAQLRRRVAAEVGLPITVGAATTKFVAKVASAVAKPDGLLVVPPGGELAFLHPLPVERLWGVGEVTARKLHGCGIRTVAQVAEMGEAALVALLGPGTGHHLHALAHARDPRRVRTDVHRRSVGAQCALGWATRDLEHIDATALALVDRVANRMRGAHRIGRTVTLRLRFADFTRCTRSHTLGTPTDSTPALVDALRTLLRNAAPLITDQGATLVGVAVSGLVRDGAVQLELPFEPARTGDLDRTLDQVRDRFGTSAVTRGVLVGRHIGTPVPTLPDR
ncbi:DNA polymerase IV [Nakamurella leprariae]|uniref:DNA polymerase IV n=1 Tax=Nakamurella leprariae TaxID=2803911 RepID=UPI002E2A20D7|nr:DNA polymerase IV [Nakamurella leprariae]